MSQIITYDNKNLITTPFPKVLSILNEAKKFISLANKPAQRLLNDICWIIKVIQNHSLYLFDFCDKEKIEELEKNNYEFREFIDLVLEYNKLVTEVGKKNSQVLSKSSKFASNLGLSQDPSFQIKKIPGYGNQNYSFKKTIPKYTSHPIKMGYKLNKSINNSREGTAIKTSVPNIGGGRGKNGLGIPKCLQITIDLKDKMTKDLGYNGFHPSSPFQYQAGHQNYASSKDLSCSADLLKNSQIEKYEKAQKKSLFENINMQILKVGFDSKKILTKEFNIFELKNIIGHDNVLPLVGKTILEGLGVTEEILNFDKLESFLKTISNTYLKSTLYHNSLHGSDVTHTCCQIFVNSNARKILNLSNLDIMEIIIGALGHDTGHPGLTNNFHINASTELAMTYNDISCLENFHVSRVFNIAKKPENNIFDKLNNSDFKLLRKRMISMILSTDMANHGKIMADIKNKIQFKEEEAKTSEFEIGNPNEGLVNKKVEEIFYNKDNLFANQQSFLDYFIHSADLAHNTKLFHISLKWVELLSNEFWIQGDKEKALNLPVSFLCDRNDTNVPKSQVGFIKGFIIPTFELLINIFPSLDYMVDNAKNNMNEWQKIYEQGRKRGWTPLKKEIDEDSKQSHEKRLAKNGNSFSLDHENISLRKINTYGNRQINYINKQKINIVNKNNQH